MIKEGLLNEVKVFYDKNIRTKPLLNAIGRKPKEATAMAMIFLFICSKDLFLKVRKN